ncbi:MAG: transposase [Bacteroidetes bacterium]|nr:transposase [Bacteroidota bacterium]
MILESGKYYHLYNRSNNREIVFKEEENHEYFLAKYQKLISPYAGTIAYCLMPTHFHFCIKVTTDDMDRLRDNIGILLSSYTKGINKRFDRHGSLFQKHTKAIWIEDESYLITVCRYIHLNPLRAKLVMSPVDWQFSSYGDYAGIRKSMPLSKGLLINESIQSSEQLHAVGADRHSPEIRYWLYDRTIMAHQKQEQLPA